MNFVQHSSLLVLNWWYVHFKGQKSIRLQQTAIWGTWVILPCDDAWDTYRIWSLHIKPEKISQQSLFIELSYRLRLRILLKIGHQLFTAAFKLKVIQIAEVKGNRAVARKYDIAESNVHRWRADEGNRAVARKYDIAESIVHRWRADKENLKEAPK